MSLLRQTATGIFVGARCASVVVPSRGARSEARAGQRVKIRAFLAHIATCDKVPATQGRDSFAHPVTSRAIQLTPASPCGLYDVPINTVIDP